jgi:hypothetical protein
MMITDEEKRLYQERAQAYYDEYMAVPESKRSEFVLNVVNEALLNEGLDPLERLATDEEVEAAIKALHTPAKKPSFRQRFRRAWAVLWPKDY